jgi:hypothetical protein
MSAADFFSMYMLPFLIHSKKTRKKSKVRINILIKEEPAEILLELQQRGIPSLLV